MFRNARNLTTRLIASAQIAGSSESLAHGFSEQAASLQEVGSSLAEMQGIAGRNRQNAQGA